MYGAGGNGTKSDNTPLPFQVLFQSADNPPPANWTGNWMPTPTNRGAFRVVMRLYGAEEEVVNGSYSFPVQQQIAAITSS